PGGREGRLSLASRPAAVVVWSLAAAVGALAAAKRRGLDVPGELSLVGFHDVPLAEYLDRPLRTVRMPLAEMAERGVEMLLQMIEGGRVRSQVVQTLPELVLRSSTAPPPST